MKNLKQIITFIAVVLFLSPLHSQELKIRWSGDRPQSNKTGFFSGLIGTNSKYIYSLEEAIAFRSAKGPAMVKLVAYDKKTLNSAAEFIVYTKDNNNKSADGGKIQYYKTIILENVIYVFWKVDQKQKDELYVQAFDPKLKSIQKRKKVYEVYSDKKSRGSANIIVLGNQNSNNQLMIIGELPLQEGENYKIEYKVVNQDFTFGASKQITLPIQQGKSRRYSGYGNNSSYEFGNDGNLYITSYVLNDKEERKENKGTQLYRPIFSVVDVKKNGELHSLDMKFEKKNIFDYHFYETENEVKFIGMYCDLNLDTRGNDLHGLFTFTINKSDFSTSTNFEDFSKETLNKLFSKDIEDRADKTGVFSSKKKKESEAESLGSLYEIEYSLMDKENNITLFCTKEYNYSVTTCSGSGSSRQCTTRYYCEKSNVTVFKISPEGKLIWASNIDRQITYSGWNIDDVNVITNTKDGSYCIAYGSRFDIDAEKKSGRSKKSAKEVTGKVEYAIMNAKTGEFKKKELTLNAAEVKKSQRKRYDPSKVEIIDNKFYIQSSNLKSKKWPFFVCIACPPFAIYAFSPANKVGTGNLGEMSLDGK